MKKDPTLLNRYFDDFIHSKLHLESLASSETPLTRRLLRSYTGDLQTDESVSVPACLAQLHIRLHVRKLNLTRVTSILKQLSKVHSTIQDFSTPLSPRSSRFDFSLPQPSDEVPQTIIVDFLFSFVKRSVLNPVERRTQRLTLFFECYQELVSVNNSLVLSGYPC